MHMVWYVYHTMHARYVTLACMNVQMIIDMHACLCYACMGIQSQYTHGKVFTLLKQSAIKGMYYTPHMPKICHSSIFMYKLLDMHSCMLVVPCYAWVCCLSLEKYNYIYTEIFHTLVKCVLYTPTMVCQRDIPLV